MNERDSALVVLVTGAVAAWMGFSGRALNYIRPSMVPYLELGGTVVAVVAAVALTISLRRRLAPPRDAREHHEHRSQVVWLLLLPIVAAVVIAPTALGSWAVDQRQGAGFARPEHFDLAAFLHTQTVAGTTPRMGVKEFVTAGSIAADRGTLASLDVELVGFVSHPEGAPDHIAITRFVISCCAADATPLSVDLVNAPAGLKADEWVDAKVRFEPARSPIPKGDLSLFIPAARVLSLHKVPRPDAPYESAYH